MFCYSPNPRLQPTPASQPKLLKKQRRASFAPRGQAPLANSSHRKCTSAHRSPASQPSPLDEQNRAVMLREGERGTG